MSFAVVFIAVIILLLILLGPMKPYLTNTSPSPQVEYSYLGLGVMAPPKAMYGDSIPVNVIANYSGSSPQNPHLILSMTLNGQMVDREERQLRFTSNQDIESFNVVLADPTLVLQKFVDSALVSCYFSADNAKQSQNSTVTVHLWKPSATMSVKMPNDNPLSLITGTQIKAGTHLFNEITVQYTGSEPGPFHVAVAVSMDPQFQQFFMMNPKLTQSLTAQGQIVWLVTSDSMQPSHPTWIVPLDNTQFTVSTGGANSASVGINVELLLVLNNGHYLIIADSPRTFTITK